MKNETESGEEEIKPKLRRKPTELDSDDDEDTIDDVKPLKQVVIDMNIWKKYRMYTFLLPLAALISTLHYHRNRPTDGTGF